MSEPLLNLAAWIDRRKADVGPYADHIVHSVRAYEAHIAALQEQNMALREALEPFSREAGWWFERGYNSDDAPVEGFEDYDPAMTCGDLFRARQVFASTKKESGE